MDGSRRRLWRLLGFRHRPPERKRLALAFSLMGRREYQSPELRGVIWLVGDPAACKLLAGVRA
jgi:hypothetical protein